MSSTQDEKEKKRLHLSIYERQAALCSALAHPIRLQILDVLSEGEKTVGEILDIISIPKANLSQHLSVLKDAGILKSRKEGVFHYTSLSMPKIKDACAMVRELLIEKLDREEKENALLIQKLKEN